MADTELQSHHPQRDKRTHIEALDPHGRKWGAVVDIAAKPKPGPCSPWAPLGWSAPLIPEQKYLQWSPDSMFTLGINYTQMKADRKEARENWLTEFHKIASEMNPRDAGASLIGNSRKDYEDASPALLRAVGPKAPAIEPVIAAEQGNGWILGKTQTPDPRLTPFFPVRVAETFDFRDTEVDYSDPVEPENAHVRQTWNEFVAEQMKAGKSMAEAAVVWNEMKDAIAA